MRRLEEFLKKKVNSAIDKDEDSWPPVCLGIFHQPERPSLSEVQNAEGMQHRDRGHNV